MGVPRLVAACAVGWTLGSAAVAAEDLVEWGRHPGPARLAGLFVDDDRTVHAADYTGRRIAVLDQDGAATTHVDLDDLHPVSLRPFFNGANEGFAVAGHDREFGGDIADMPASRLVLLSTDGSVAAEIDASQTRLLGSMVYGVHRGLLVADGAAGRIWRLDPGPRTLHLWLADDRLAPVTAPAFVPGVTALRRDGATLYIAVAASGMLYRLPIGGDAMPAGHLQAVDAFAGLRDFVVLPEGGLVVATDTGIVRRDADGTRTVISEDPRVQELHAISLVGRGADRRLIVTGAAPDTGEAMVAALPLPEAAADAGTAGLRQGTEDPADPGMPPPEAMDQPPPGASPAAPGGGSEQDDGGPAIAPFDDPPLPSDATGMPPPGQDL